jgi:replicative DNA helicase
MVIGNQRAPVEDRELAMTSVALGLKRLVRELRTPVIVFSHLNREIELDNMRKHRPSDIRDSDAIAEAAYVVALLCSPRYEHDYESGVPSGAIPMNLFIAKLRNG